MIVQNIYEFTNFHFENEPVVYKTVDKSESISSIISFELTQSQCITLGSRLEKILREYISSFDHVRDIKPKNKKGKKERDHLFCINGSKKIYAELKCNLNLDTEKKSKTIEKVKYISSEEQCDGFLVALRYYTNVPKRVKLKYNDIKVLSISEYFRLFDIECPFGNVEMGYKIWLNQVAKEIMT